MGVDANGMPDFAAPDEPDDPVAARLSAAEAARAQHETAQAALDGTAHDETAHDEAADVAAGDTADGVRAAHDAAPRRSRRARVVAAARAPWVAFIAGAAIVVAAASVVPIVHGVAASADEQAVAQVVDDYVAALAEGDVAAASELEPLDEDEASTDLLDAFDPESVEIEAGAPRLVGDVAAVDVSITIQALEVDGRLRLERGEDGWRIVVGLASVVHLWDASTIASVGGVAVQDAPERAWLYPGMYEIEGVSSPLLQPSSSSVPVVPGAWAYGGTAIQVDVNPTPQLEAQVQEAAIAFAERCAAQPTDGCPQLGSPGQDATFEADVTTSGTFAGMRLMRLEVLVTRLEGGEAVADAVVDVYPTPSDDMQSATYVVAESVQVAGEPTVIEP